MAEGRRRSSEGGAAAPGAPPGVLGRVFVAKRASSHAKAPPPECSGASGRGTASGPPAGAVLGAPRVLAAMILQRRASLPGTAEDGVLTEGRRTSSHSLSRATGDDGRRRFFEGGRTNRGIMPKPVETTREGASLSVVAPVGP